MAKLSARRCETERPDKSGKDKLPGDGDGLLLRITPRGTKTWIIDYEFHSRHRKCKLEAFELAGGPDTDIGQWLTHGSLSPGQARSIAAQWKADRRADETRFMHGRCNFRHDRVRIEHPSVGWRWRMSASRAVCNQLQAESRVVGSVRRWPTCGFRGHRRGRVGLNKYRLHT